jgi:hypothetical protein
MSELAELDARLATMTRARVRRRGSDFLDQEDANSALVSPIARKLATQCGFEFEAIIQPLIDIFGLTFNRNNPVEEEAAESIMSAAVEVLFLAGIGDRIQMGKNDSVAVLSFLRDNMSRQQVRLIVSAAAEIQLVHAHRFWRAILSIARLGFQNLHPAEDTPSQWKGWQFLAVGIGRLCVPVLIKLIQAGKASQLEQSIAVIRSYVSKYGPINLLYDIKNITKHGQMDLLSALDSLSAIWQHQGFPFSYSKQ